MHCAKILVVDDEKFIRNFVRQALERQGHRVTLARSGEEGLVAFQADAFDLILTDVKMDDMDGIEMLRQIREQDTTVVGVVITAMQDQQTAVRALECGVHDFLIKPFTLEELNTHIAHALAERTRIVEDLNSRELLESQLFQTERLSLLGQMAPRIAHEFKTPLQLVSGNAELAKIWLEQGNVTQALDTIERILPATQQLLYMVQQMTNLGKPAVKHKEPVDLVRLIDAMLETLQPLGFLKYCQIERNYDVAECLVFGDPDQIEQVMRNLVVNAAQAMEDVSVKNLTIGIACGEQDVCVRVQDTGHGIPEDKLEDIFQPFYTTKPEGKGTGLGLAIVRSMLKRHQADIAVESEVGTGTTFYLRFPIYQESVASETIEVGV